MRQEPAVWKQESAASRQTAKAGNSKQEARSRRNLTPALAGGAWSFFHSALSRARPAGTGRVAGCSGPREGYDPAFGARPLKRIVQKNIQDPIALRMLKGEFKEKDHIKIDTQKEDFIFV